MPGGRSSSLIGQGLQELSMQKIKFVHLMNIFLRNCTCKCLLYQSRRQVNFVRHLSRWSNTTVNTGVHRITESSLRVPSRVPFRVAWAVCSLSQPSVGKDRVAHWTYLQFTGHQTHLHLMTTELP